MPRFAGHFAHLSTLFCISVTALALSSGCSSSEDELGNPVTDNPCDIPVETRASLLEWLEDEEYLAWSAESAPHDSSGPHFGNVRTWISAELEQSLQDGSDSHPLCSAAVKELYGDGETRRGFSVSVKVANDGRASDWYWYEVYDDETIAAGTDVDTCVGCHSRGIDHVRTPFPLQ